MSLYTKERDRILENPNMSDWLRRAVFALDCVDADAAVHDAGVLFALSELRTQEFGTERKLELARRSILEPAFAGVGAPNRRTGSQGA